MLKNWLVDQMIDALVFDSVVERALRKVRYTSYYMIADAYFSTFVTKVTKIEEIHAEHEVVLCVHRTASDRRLFSRKNSAMVGVLQDWYRKQ